MSTRYPLRAAAGVAVGVIGFALFAPPRTADANSDTDRPVAVAHDPAPLGMHEQFYEETRRATQEDLVPQF